jgi:hypothetical protein
VRVCSILSFMRGTSLVQLYSCRATHVVGLFVGWWSGGLVGLKSRELNISQSIVLGRYYSKAKLTLEREVHPKIEPLDLTVWFFHKPTRPSNQPPTTATRQREHKARFNHEA